MQIQMHRQRQRHTRTGRDGQRGSELESETGRDLLDFEAIRSAADEEAEAIHQAESSPAAWHLQVGGLLSGEYSSAAASVLFVHARDA